MRPDAAAVVTGLGAVTGFGCGIEKLWAGLCSGATSVRPLSDAVRQELFDPAAHRTQIAAAVELGSTEATSMSRADRFAMAAAEEAVAQAFGAGGVPAERTGVFFGSSTGALLETERVFVNLMSGSRPLPLRNIGSQQHNGPGDTVARRFGVCGPVVTLTSACASSTMAIGAALDALRAGEVDVAIAGGADELSQITYAGFNSLRAVAKSPTRPFRVDRTGLSLGEGSGVLVLETVEHAARRGATGRRVHVAGAASSCDAHHMSAPLGDGSGAARAMRLAIEDADLQPEAIAFLNVHGTGTPQNDKAEWQAIRTVFGELASEIPVVASKGAIGHLLGASGAIEAVATALSLQHDTLPPTPGDGEVDPELPVRLILDRPLPLCGARAGLSTNLAFGGANSALVLTAEVAP